MSKEIQKFWVSQSATWIKDGKCLILEARKRPGYWGLVGGRIDKGEEAEEGFKRELKEEINLLNFENLGVVDYLVFYKNSSGKEMATPVCLVVSLIKSDQIADIRDLNEHSNLAWINEDEIDNYQYVVSGIDKIIKKAFLKYKGIS